MKTLKAYCHTSETFEAFSAPLHCREVSFQASPEALRAVAAFLSRCADRLDGAKADMPDHLHLRDEWKGWCDEYVDVVVLPAE